MPVTKDMIPFIKIITRQKVLGYGILILFFLGCIKDPEVDERVRCKNGSAVRKVLIIGIDGCRTDAFLAAHHPAFDSLMAHAYVNLNCDRGPNTISGPGWSTILHGVFPAKHGVTSNTISPSNFAQYPDLFYYLRRHNASLNLSVIAGWEPFLEIVSNESYEESTYDPHDAAVTDARTKSRAVRLLSSCPPDVFILHLEDVDSKGHFSGFSPTNPDYMGAIARTGNHVGDIMSVIKQREQNNGEEWLVYVVTDHGGVGYYHGNQDTVPETRYVFQVARLPNMSRVNIPNASNTNVVPTVLKYMGVPIDTAWGLDGTPLF